MSAPARTNPAVQSLAEAAGAEEAMSEGANAYPASIASAAAVPERPPVVQSITPPTVAPLPNQPAFASQERASSSIPAVDQMLPTHDSLVASGTSLPDMRLDIHVYSPNPRDRFVFVNMRKYVEGQTLSEGAVLERITADGAILNQHGTRFLLPRQ
jgi:general secretion pathway protein B